jgi:hypothetical protein
MAYSMAHSISQILDEVVKYKKRTERIAALKKYDSVPLRMFLGIALDPRVQFDLPEGPIEYKPSKLIIDQENSLLNEASRMYLFLKTPNPIFGEKGNPDVKQERRKLLFIQLLESITPRDAEFLLCAREKKLPVRGITVKMMNETFGTSIPVDDDKAE